MSTLDARLARLMKNREFLKALEEIRKQGREGQDIADGFKEALEMLPLAACLAVTYTRSTRTTPREEWQQNWARHAGMSWKQLTEFPERIRRMAEEIERVQKHVFFDPKQLKSETRLAKYAKGVFPTLPVVLQHYADFLKAEVKGNSALLKSFYLRVPRKHSSFILVLSKQVKIITGTFHDSKVADLLNAADYALNATTKTRFQTQLILDLRIRQKRKTTRT
jgi:hypothetical protein